MQVNTRQLLILHIRLTLLTKKPMTVILSRLEPRETRQVKAIPGDIRLRTSKVTGFSRLTQEISY